MYERRRRLEWRSRSLADPTEEGRGYYGSIDVGESSSSSATETTDGKGKGREVDSVEDILSANAEMIDELERWQDVRVKKGDASWVCEREQQVGKCSIGLNDWSDLYSRTTPGFSYRSRWDDTPV
jgi:hypothetical protein